MRGVKLALLSTLLSAAAKVRKGYSKVKVQDLVAFDLLEGKLMKYFPLKMPFRFRQGRGKRNKKKFLRKFADDAEDKKSGY